MMSEIKICNLALAELGATAIASLTENSSNARYCNTFYSTSRNAVLRDYAWNFASYNRGLASVEVPDGYKKWSYAFGYPVDCLLARELHDDAGSNFPFEVGVYSGVGSEKLKAIFANVSAAYLRYTVEITNTELFDHQFVVAFSKYLAKELAWPVTKKANLEQTMFQKYLQAIPKAQVSDADEKDIDTATTDPWIDDRLA